MSHRFLLLLAGFALVSGCAYGVDESDGQDHDDASAEQSAPLEVGAPAAAEATPREPGKPQPDPWGRTARTRENPADQLDVEPSKPQPDPWRPSTTATSATTNSK